MPNSALWGDSADLLTHTLAHAGQPVTQTQQALANGGLARLLACGVLHLQPAEPGQEQLILSAGLHGNETAPIELLNQITEALVQGQTALRMDTLVILGNPPAMQQAVRHLEHNLNRLFCGAHNSPALSHCQEAQRAAELETLVRQFVRPDNALRHYDLHTAIRPSRREKFALYPFIPERQVPAAQLDFLARSGISTLVLQHKPASTFAAWTARTFAAESFTLELGKVEPFGHNDLSRLQALKCQLQRLLAQTAQNPADSSASARVEQFQVVHEILHPGEGFILHIPDEVANFTEYPPGSLIWEQGTHHYRVGDQPEAIVFPNRAVPVGQRAGLMLRRIPSTN